MGLTMVRTAFWLRYRDSLEIFTLSSCLSRNVVSAPRGTKGLAKRVEILLRLQTTIAMSSKNYIDAMISAFKANGHIGFIGGRVLLYDQSDLKLTIQESEDYLALQPRTFVAAGTIHGANMAFRRMVLDRIGGFDERFGAGTSFGCGEDIDAVASALWAGFAGAYDPGPTVYHHHGRKTKREARDLFKTYDRGRGAYYAKYILRSDSRNEYLGKWMGEVRRRAINGHFIGRLSDMRRSFREFYGALHYVAAWACSHFFAI